MGSRLNAVVIGYGNTLRRDDGAGPRVAELLAASKRPGVAVWNVHQLTPELAEALAGADVAVFVDVAAQPVDAEVRVQEIEPDPSSAGALGHVSDPRVLLYLAEALHGRRARPCWLVTIPGVDFEHGEGLSAVAEAGVSAALVEVSRLLGLE